MSDEWWVKNSSPTSDEATSEEFITDERRAMCDKLTSEDGPRHLVTDEWWMMNSTPMSDNWWTKTDEVMNDEMMKQSYTLENKTQHCQQQSNNIELEKMQL